MSGAFSRLSRQYQYRNTRCCFNRRGEQCALNVKSVKDMSGALALDSSEQAIPVEMQDGVLKEEESALIVKKGKSDKGSGSGKDDPDDPEEKEEDEEGSSKEKQMEENEVKSKSSQNKTSGSQINKGSQTTEDSTQAAWRDLKLTFPSTKLQAHAEAGFTNGEAGNNKTKRFLKKTGGFVLKTALISGAVIGGTTLLLPVIGFGALGPIAGSMAAAYQSSVGAVAAGSIFSTLQSVGMVGLSAAAQGGIVAGSAVVSAATSNIKLKKKDGK